MEMVELGRTGLTVSRLGLGLASLGGMFAAVPDQQAVATIDRAWELGIRLFDTAPVYGYGLSEQRAGLALRGRPRPDFVLCTEVGGLIEPGGPDIQPIWAEPPRGLGPRLDYSYSAVMRSFEESLARMGIDRIDILHIHDPELDFAKASTSALNALTELRGRGTIGAISLGVNHAGVAAQFLRSVAPSALDCILLAGRYTLLDQSAAEDLLPLCRDLGVPVLAAGAFQGGALASPSGVPAVAPRDTSIGTPQNSSAPGPRRRGRSSVRNLAPAHPPVPAALAARIEGLHGLCRQYAVPPLAAAVQFPLAHPVVPVVIVGARSPAEISEVATLLDHEIPGDFWRALERAGLIAARAEIG
jgi:D-threo-aldose 1-dehydrogenase